LLAAGKSRVVILSSRGHQMSDVDLEDIDFARRPYDKWMAWANPRQLIPFSRYRSIDAVVGMAFVPFLSIPE
jgi:hypothetical protein